jgi:hypothetical protein
MKEPAAVFRRRDVRAHKTKNNFSSAMLKDSAHCRAA